MFRRDEKNGEVERRKKGKGVTMADMQKHRVYKLNLNKFGRFMLCLASAIGMTYIWVEILLGLAGM